MFSKEVFIVFVMADELLKNIKSTKCKLRKKTTTYFFSSLTALVRRPALMVSVDISL